jgi:hypothetical protein
MVRGAMRDTSRRRVGVGGECSRPYLGPYAALVVCVVAGAGLVAAAPDGGGRSLAQAGAGYRFMRVHLDSTSLYRYPPHHHTTLVPPVVLFIYREEDVPNARSSPVYLFSPSCCFLLLSTFLPPRRVPSRGASLWPAIHHPGDASFVFRFTRPAFPTTSASRTHFTENDFPSTPPPQLSHIISVQQ